MSNSGRDQITEESCQNANWQKDLLSYLIIVEKKDVDLNEANKPAKEKTASSTYVTPDKFTERSRTDSERSNAGDSFQPRDQRWRYTTLHESSFQQGS